MSDIFDTVRAAQIAAEAENPTTLEALETYRIQYLGSGTVKGVVDVCMAEIKSVPNEQKREFGQLVNALKNTVTEKVKNIREQFQSAAESSASADFDLSAPSEPLALGSRHPIATTLNRINEIFARIGFSVVDGPEIETDWFNFTAMNTPEDHPARDMQDTFYIADAPGMLLRTHTSPVQARTMTNRKPPIRVIAPGRVFRNETISARSHAQFHQVEGLYIDKNVSFADLKQTLLYFAREMYGADTKIRMRPSFFPFTEPSAEVDVTCFICTGKGCPVCKQTGWLEILGCGMVDPQVLENCGIDPKEYSGFAFGMGVERQAMMLYKVTDIRLMFENDVRFLRQFSATI
jgi:phenylalanyl-tRNA synthetase alpha chain